MRLKITILLSVCITSFSCVRAQYPHVEQHQFGDQKAINDAEHLKQHLKDQIEVNEADMTDEQRRFHYFNMHDLNKDSLIDGVEIIKAMVHDHSDDEAARPGPQPNMEESVLEDMVDNVLKQIDLNNDGFIDYAEYTRSHG